MTAADFYIGRLPTVKESSDVAPQRFRGNHGHHLPSLSSAKIHRDANAVIHHSSPSAGGGTHSQAAKYCPYPKDWRRSTKQNGCCRHSGCRGDVCDLCTSEITKQPPWTLETICDSDSRHWSKRHSSEDSIWSQMEVSDKDFVGAKRIAARSHGSAATSVQKKKVNWRPVEFEIFEATAPPKSRSLNSFPAASVADMQEKLGRAMEWQLLEGWHRQLPIESMPSVSLQHKRLFESAFASLL